MELSVKSNVNNAKKPARYLIPEAVYDYNHPHVVHYTQYFIDRASSENVFEKIDAALKVNNNEITAQKMADAWYEFSKYVPIFITKAVTLTNDPEQQHHLIQIAYDELGGRDKNLVHSKLFIEALEAANIPLSANTAILSIQKVLSSLTKTLEKTKTQSGIIGLLLSFEIIAETNIETLFQGLGYTPDRQEILSDSLFFKIHRADEIEHIRHSVANFLRFSTSNEQIEEAEEFFDAGIVFWKSFWNEMTNLIGTK